MIAKRLSVPKWDWLKGVWQSLNDYFKLKRYQLLSPANYKRLDLISQPLLASSGYRIDLAGSCADPAFDLFNRRAFAKLEGEGLAVIYDRIGLGQA